MTLLKRSSTLSLFHDETQDRFEIYRGYQLVASAANLGVIANIWLELTQ